MPDQADRWRLIETLFHRASAMPADERAVFLDRECDGDPGLRRSVADLIAADSESAIIEQAIASEARFVLDEFPPGATFGPFLVEELLGRGGMGAVYRAVRTDRDFTHQVALKLVRSHLHADEWTRRFLRERQILARLDHPFIARLLDGGSIDGRPYIVMEYVQGVTADTYVSRQDLNLRDRVILFRKACEAVGYAHGQLVVHRDIKPQNILVQSNGSPKLLDFGIAKPLEEDEDGALTRASQRVLTPHYAAPEQVLGLPVTAATDVYALGALLYCLLTGKAPFQDSGLSGFALEKAILDQEPTAPGTLIRHADSDIDAIVSKAMRKEPARRYSSVAALQADLDRWLDGYPVDARRGNWRYRSIKFLRRRAGTVLAISLVIGSLAAGVVSTRIQQQKAERRLEDIRELANRFLFEFHDSIAALPGATQSRQMVVARAVEYLDRLASETGDDLRLERDLATGYERIRDIQFGVTFGHLNDVPGALASGKRAVTLRQRLHRANPSSADDLSNYAKSHLDLTLLLIETGDSLDEAQSHLNQAQRLFETLGRLDSDPLRKLRNQAAVDSTSAILERARGQGNAAVASGRRAVVLRDQVMASGGGPDDAYRLHLSLIDLGDALLLGANLPMEALPHYERARDLLTGKWRGTRPAAQEEMDLGQVLARIGLSYAIAGRHREALPFRRQALQFAESIAARDPRNALAARDLGVACINAAQNEYKVGSKAEAVRLARRMVAMFEIAMQQSPGSVQARMDYAAALEDLADYLVRTEGRAEPEALLRKAIAIREEAVRQDPERGVLRSHLAHAWTQFADSYAQWGDVSNAEQFYNKALRAYEQLEKDNRINGLDRSDWERTRNSLAKLRAKQK
jgi:eukaryotic-like serine/threonine-protein kinase